MTGYYSHKAVEDLAPPPTGPAPRARRADDSVEPPFIPLCSVMDEHICRAHDDAYLHHSPLTRPFSDETTEHSVGECDACAEWNPPPRVRQFGSSAVTGSGAVPAGAQSAVADGEAPNGSVHSEGDTA